MPNSYQSHVANGVSNSFSFASIDGYLQLSHLKVYVNGTLRATNTYTIDAAAKTVSLSTAPASGDVVKVARETPNTVATRPVDFTDGSVLTATDLDTANLQTIFLAQEAADSGGAAFQKTATNQSWDAQSIRISAVAPPTSGTDAATKDYVDALGLVGGLGGAPVAEPQAWAFTGNGSTTAFPLTNPVPNATQANMFIVEVGGVLQHPNVNYTITSNGVLTFESAPSSNNTIRVRNFGIARSITESVTTLLIANGAVTSAKLGTASVVPDKIQNNSISVEKLSSGMYAAGTFSPTYVLMEGSTNVVRTATFTYSDVTAGAYVRIGGLFAFSLRIATTAMNVGDSVATDVVTISGFPSGFSITSGLPGSVSIAYANGFPSRTPSGGLLYLGSRRMTLYARGANASETTNSLNFQRLHLNTGAGNDVIASGIVLVN